MRRTKSALIEVGVTPLTVEDMGVPNRLPTLIAAHLFPTKRVPFRRRRDGQWQPTEPVVFENLPAGTYTHVLVGDKLVALDGNQR